MLSFKRLIHSFKDALHGLAHTFRREQNFRVQVLIGIFVTALAIYFPLRVWEVIVLILLMGWVLTMELLNTAFEYFTDLLKPRLHHYVHAVKDIMAAAVLISSLGAATIGVIIFLPHFLNLLK
ncbi:diacylglycerol kinase [Patescibacteria group bacterium]|nr:diacylglycerol kinase [Patescibacteria group bacterium]MBU1613508.1 diacylglycerol kinase [Patescibacteria group bacterium]